MAGVELTLTKGSSGTQCPHPTGAPTENGSTALSKSKKKRLRKRKKTETAAKGSTEFSQTIEDSTKSAEVDIVSTKKTETVELISKNSEATVSKDRKPVKKLIGDSKSKVKKTDSEPNISKSTKVESLQNNKIKASELNTPEHQKAMSKPDLKQGAASGVMETDKSTRNEVMAQREAKKLAKLAKKNKTAGGGANAAQVQADSKVTKPDIKVQLPSNVQSAQNDTSVSGVSAQLNQLTVDYVDGEIVKPTLKVGNVVPVLSKPSPVTAKCTPATPASALVTPQSAVATTKSAPPTDQVSDKTEKSREEIIAEREAKKQAKLLSKNKKKDVTQFNNVSAETAKPAPEAKKSVESSPLSVQSEVNHLAQDGPPSNKSKASLRAERRAKQEAQRAAKEGLKKETENTKPAVKPSLGKSEQAAGPKDTNKPAAKTLNKTQNSKSVIKASSSHQPKLLSHLLTDSKPLPPHIYQNVHPAIVELGAKYAARVVSGSNARCIALLQALKKVIVDFVTPREKEFSRAMEVRLNDSMAYLNACRQSSVSMTNALKHVKSHLTQLTAEKTTDDDARKKLCEVIDTFIKEEIDVAGQAISLAVAPKISDGDTIAIYGCSSLLLRILVESHNEGKDFEVVVVDGGPVYEGREMCRRLVSENIKCSYVLLPAFSYIVGQTTKVLLGAHALLANGCVMSRSGTAVVAMLAKSHNVPVIVCCETYKFCERVQADAFVHNELGPQDKGSSPPSICLMYDMTPPTLVDAVATDLAILPCTSVPVILRVQSNPSDISPYYY